MPLPPVDDQISIGDLTTNPYSFYRKARAEHPVVTVSAVGRTMLTKAADTKFLRLGTIRGNDSVHYVYSD